MEARYLNKIKSDRYFKNKYRKVLRQHFDDDRVNCNYLFVPKLSTLYLPT